MATEKDLAKKAGLGLGTVSKYLNGGQVLEKNKRAIEDAIKELGYTVNEHARALKTNQSKTVGIAIPDITNIFVANILTVLEDVLRASGYGTIICGCQTDEEKERDSIRFLMGKRVDGIISMPVSASGGYLDDPILKHVPVVLIDRFIPFEKDVYESNLLGAVLVDTSSASKSAVELLLKSGHKNIGMLFGPRNIFTSQQRFRGCSEAYEENFLTLSDDLAIFSDFTVQGGYEGMKELLQKGVTAVFATNHELTLGAFIAINELGINIPDDLSFIGFDNVHLSRIVKPKLATVEQPLAELGGRAASLLLEMMLGFRAYERIVTLPAKILSGESIMPPQ
jgi:DNA-binding LacI/PurR family transcriptional regulator